MRLLRGFFGIWIVLCIVVALTSFALGSFATVFYILPAFPLVFLAVTAVLSALTRLLEDGRWKLSGYVQVNACLGMMASIIVGPLLLGEGVLTGANGVWIVAICTAYGVVTGALAGIGYRIAAGRPDERTAIR